MKIKILFILVTLIMAFSSCRKCVTCVAYNATGSSYPVGTVSSTTQSVRECNKEMINAYETGTNYTDPQGNPVKFQCK